jgi:hypothetical protein
VSDISRGAQPRNNSGISASIVEIGFPCRRLAGSLPILPCCLRGIVSPPAGGIVKYLPPFDLIRRMVEVSTVKGELRVSLSYDDFIKIMRLMISGIEVNQDWYLEEH